MCSRTIKGSYDVVVIGSGISGLTTACILGRLGKKVLVLEQHDRAGGCLHTFNEGGYRFSSGNHYIGEFDKTSIKLIEVCGSSVQKQEGTIETFIRDGEKKVISDRQSWKEVMGCEPGKVERMADTMWWIAFVKLAPDWLSYLAWCFVCAFYSSSFTQYDVWMNGSGWCQMQEGDVGCKPIAMVGAAVSRHYMDGLSKLSDKFVYECCKTIKSQSGSVVVNKRVKSIRDNGVILGDDVFVPAKQIVSSIGALGTCAIADLPQLESVVTGLGQSVLHGFVFVGLQCSRKEAAIPCGVIWISENERYLFVSSDEQEGKLAVHLVSEDMDTDAMKSLFYKYYPNAQNFEKYSDDASHYSVNKYLGRHASYGLSCRDKRFNTYANVRTLRPNTSLPNLYLTGQDVLMPGIVSALTTAMMTSRQVMGITLMDTVRGNDIMDIL